MRTAAPLAVLTAAVLVTVLTSCSGAPGGEAPDPADSPLNEYMSALWGGDLSEDEQIARFEKENIEREELIAQCMAEQGFEYIPNTSNGSISFGSDDEWKPDDREWVAQYGYGMVNFPGRDAPPVDQEEWVDPNQDYISALSESEQQAFYETLSGPPIPEDQLDEDGSYEYDWTQGGCYGFAQHEMEQDDPAMSDEFKPLMEAVEAFWTETQESTAFDEVNAAWSACMSDAGHTGYDAQSEAQMRFSEELNSYYENQTEWVEDDPELAALGEDEIEIALADLDCREETDYRKLYAEVQHALEEAFIADHKADLDALKAAAEQGR